MKKAQKYLRTEYDRVESIEFVCGLCATRFTVVTRTRHTSLPTGADKYRLASVSSLASNLLIIDL